MAKSETDNNNTLHPNPYSRLDDPSYFAARMKDEREAEEYNKNHLSDEDQEYYKKRNQEYAEAEHLRNAEREALKNTEPSFYKGTGKPGDKPGSKKGKKGSFLLKRKKGFIGLMISLALMTGGGAFLGSTNSLLAPALNEIVTEMTDTQYASNVNRFLRITGFQIDNTALDTSWTGKLKYAHMSGSFKKRLESRGITVDGSGTHRTLTFEGETISASDFRRVYNDNVEFRDAYTGAKRGRILGFFDNIANKIYAKLGINRNLFKDYKQSPDAKVDDDAFDDTMTKKMDNDTDASLRTNYGEKTEEEVDDGAGGKKSVEGEPIDHENNSGSAKNTTPDNATNQAKSYLESVTGKIQKATSLTCTAMNVINMISIAVAANEIYQSINYFMGLAENPSKMKMGYGSESGINSMLNFMTTSDTIEIEDYNNMPKYNGNISDSKLLSVGTKPVTGSPMEAQGMVKLMTSMPVATAKTGNYSLERVAKQVQTSVTAFTACNIAKSATALVSIAVSLIPGVGQAKAIGSFFSKLAIGAVVTIGVSTLLGFLVPTIAKVFFTNAFENATGIPAGEFYAKGASAANTRIGRSGSSQSLASEEIITAYNRVNSVVLAQDAEVDRYNRSPFDITSRNTFLGSIAYGFGTTTSTGFMGKIKNLMRNTSSSISTILGQAHAEDNTDYMNTFGDCPLLESIGAKGDMYCNPITVTDPSTLNLAPDDSTYIAAIEGDLEDSGETVKIKPSGELAKYITYCDNRDSPFGAVDSNILGSLKSLGSAGDLAVGLAGSIPIAGDILDLIEAGVDEANLPWATGEKCVADSTAGSEWNTKFKYYQRFVEDQRILEQMGNYEGAKSPVAAFIEDYEAAHPLDNSPSGYLARISGLTKDNAELILDIAWYYNFVENYDATTRLAMNAPIRGIDDGKQIIAKLDHDFRYRNFADKFESPTDQYTTEAVVAKRVLYTDIRNRSYAV